MYERLEGLRELESRAEGIDREGAGGLEEGGVELGDGDGWDFGHLGDVSMCSLCSGCTILVCGERSLSRRDYIDRKITS